MFGFRHKYPSYRYNEERWATWQRSDKRCYWCGCALTVDDFTIDHIIARSKNGSKLDRDNLAVACGLCNHTKNDHDYHPAIVGPLKKWFAYLYRTTSLIEAEDVDGILKMAQEVFGITTGRGTIITLFSLPPSTKELKRHVGFKCQKPVRVPVQLEHGYPMLADETDFGHSLGALLSKAGVTCPTQPPSPTKPTDNSETPIYQPGAISQ
jgi:hypothetical protein